MKALKQQASFEGYPKQRNLKIDPELGLSRGDPLMGSDPPTESKGRYNLIGKLENNVSRLQIARHNLGRINRWLYEMKDFLKDLWEEDPTNEMPPSVSDHYLKERIEQIEMTAKAASFQGRALINGNSGVTASVRGSGFYFVRGSARVQSSNEQGYRVTIDQAATAPRIKGNKPATKERVAREEMIAIWDGVNQVRYRIKPDETPQSLLFRLNSKIAKLGMEVTLQITKEEQLTLVHHKLGVVDGFQAMSLKTNLISTLPGKIVRATQGRDIKGMIGGEKGIGEGGFLTGRKGNANTDGLVIYYPGKINFPGESIGLIKVKQAGIKVPLDIKKHQEEILSLPSLLPENLAVGVANKSGFMSLEKIRGDKKQQKKDALKLILRSLEELKYLNEELKWKEDYYVELTVKILKQSPEAREQEEDVLLLSKEKAKEMVEDLKKLVGVS